VTHHRLLRRRRTVPRRHAATALRQGCCLFAARGDCEPALAPVGLRGTEDDALVLVCRTHYTDLRRLRPYEAERLARYLYVAFTPQPGPAPERDEGLTVVHVRAHA
jgi:hypothetical protein